MDIKKVDHHRLAIGGHPKKQLSEDCIGQVIAKIRTMNRDQLYAVGEGKYF